MKLSVLGGLLGILGGSSVGLELENMSALTPPLEDTCTPAGECKITTTTSGSFTAVGSPEAGGCFCHERNCATKHCKVDLQVTVNLPGGGSWKVSGTGNCNATQEPAIAVVVNNCGTAGGFVRLVYPTKNDCTGNQVWYTYNVRCEAGNCGGYTCP